MPSFLEKLKKGMGVETESEITAEPMPLIKKPKKKQPVIPQELKMVQQVHHPEQNRRIEPEPIKKIEVAGLEKSFGAAQDKKEWFEEPAGQLAIDVFQTEQDLIIQTAIAGIKPGNLEVTVERDIVAIRGIRQKPSKEEGEYFTKECYWGPFAREIIVPVEIDPDRIEAVMQEGVLTVRMPKILREKKRIITVKS